MTLNEAKDLLSENEHLLETNIGDFYIEHLMVIPVGYDEIFDLLFKKLSFIDTSEIYEKYNDFEVIAICEDYNGIRIAKNINALY